MKYNISHHGNKIVLINLILATSQHYPRSSSFTSCCTHRSVPVLSFNFLMRGQTHQEAMSQSFCQYTTKQSLKWSNLSVWCFPRRIRTSFCPSSSHTRTKAAVGMHTSWRADSVNIWQKQYNRSPNFILTRCWWGWRKRPFVLYLSLEIFQRGLLWYLHLSDTSEFNHVAHI